MSSGRTGTQVSGGPVAARVTATIAGVEEIVGPAQPVGRVRIRVPLQHGQPHRRHGSIEPGKVADLAVWRIDDALHSTIADPVAALALGAPPPLTLLLVNGWPAVRRRPSGRPRRGHHRP
jgi:hypothetical protein